jgi:hypothetical protein
VNFCLQAEVALQFFMGTLDVSDIYCDDMRVIAKKYLSAPSGFWLDAITSLPWSFNDIYLLQVPHLIVLCKSYYMKIVF